MKEFVKIAWLNNDHKSYWRQTIHDFGVAYDESEIDSVGVTRSGAIIFKPPKELPDFCSKHVKLHFLVTGCTALANTYTNKTQPVGDGPCLMRVLVSDKKIDEIPDDARTGRILGYPLCCIQNFASWWGKHEDPTYETYKHRYIHSNADILLRQLGVRYVRHLPCNAGCRESIRQGTELYNYILYKQPSTILAIHKLMNSEMRWSRLHGVAEVITPIVKFAYMSDYTPIKEEFSIKGDTMVRFSQHEWKENGFSSLYAQDRAHDPIILMFLRGRKDLKNLNPKVVDYGCGNGALLEKFCMIEPSIIPYGIDCNEAALRHAEERLPMGKFTLGDIHTDFFHDNFDFSMVSTKRFKEQPELASKLLSRIRKHSTYSILYNYECDGLVKYLRHLGIEVSDMNISLNNSCEAALIRW